MTNKMLYQIWSHVNKHNAWHEKLRKLGLCEHDLAYLEDLDEDFNHSLKEAKYKARLSRHEARKHFESIEGKEYADTCRGNYVNQKIQELQRSITSLYQAYEKLYRLDKSVSERTFLLGDLAEKERELKRLGMELYCKTHSDISPEKIARAREYKIEDLIDVNARGFALCPNHPDKTPSLYTKGGFCYCFSCGWNADAIKLYQKLHNVGFIEAVRCLQGG